MSGTSITSTSIFVSTAQVGRTNDADWDQLNGVDASLTQQWNDVGQAASIDPKNKGNEGIASIQARLDFVNSLTPAQLKENAGFTMGAGWDKTGNFTWQDIKDYSNAWQGLENKVRSLMIPGVDQSNDPTINHLNDLIGGLNQNTPGAFFKATQYLAASSSTDVVTLSASAMSALATGSPATAAAAALKKEQASIGSDSDRGAFTALAVLEAGQKKDEETKKSTNGKVSEASSGSIKPLVDLNV